MMCAVSGGAPTLIPLATAEVKLGDPPLGLSLAQR
jgi:hypothetical protein